MDLKKLAKRFKAERLKRGWTAKKVVEEIGFQGRVTVKTVSDAETMDARRYPSLRVIKKLGELYGLELQLVDVKEGGE